MGDEEACEINLAELTPSNYKCHFCAHWAQNQTKAGTSPPPLLCSGAAEIGEQGQRPHGTAGVKGHVQVPVSACVCLHRTRVHCVSISMCVCTGHMCTV